MRETHLLLRRKSVLTVFNVFSHCTAKGVFFDLTVYASATTLTILVSKSSPFWTMSGWPKNGPPFPYAVNTGRSIPSASQAALFILPSFASKFLRMAPVTGSPDLPIAIVIHSE